MGAVLSNYWGLVVISKSIATLVRLFKVVSW